MEEFDFSHICLPQLILTDVTVYPVAVPLFNRADWWSPAPGSDWEPVEQGEFDDIGEPDEVSHLA